MNVFDEVEQSLNAKPSRSFRVMQFLVVGFIGLVFLMIVAFIGLMIVRPDIVADQYGRFYGRVASSAVDQFERDQSR
jgi:hypothetical protein